MKEITRIECHVTDYGKQRLKDDRFTMIHVDERKKNAVIFISPDNYPPRAFTEEQIKAIWRDLEHDFRALGKGMDIDQVSLVFTNHGITL